MNVIFKPQDGKSPYEKKLSVGSVPEMFIRAVIDGFYEIPELTEYFRKRFDNEAKEKEFNSIVQH